MPIVSAAFGAALPFVVLRLFEREHNAQRHLVPILELNAAPDQRQACRPILFGRACVLFRNRQIVKRRKRLACVFPCELRRDLFVGSLRVFLSYRLCATKNVRYGWALVSLSQNVLLVSRWS